MPHSSNGTDPSLDEGPGLVTDISASLMHAWNGGPLPRQRHRSAAGTLMAMSMQLEEEDSEVRPNCLIIIAMHWMLADISASFLVIC